MIISLTFYGKSFASTTTLVIRFPIISTTRNANSTEIYLTERRLWFHFSSIFGRIILDFGLFVSANSEHASFEMYKARDSVATVCSKIERLPFNYTHFFFCVVAIIAAATVAAPYALCKFGICGICSTAVQTTKPSKSATATMLSIAQHKR